MTATRSRLTSPFGAMVDYTLRACFPAKRRWGLLLPCLGALLFGLLAHVESTDPLTERFAAVASFGLFGLVLPIACLVIGDAVIGAEVRAGTMPFTWLSPVPFWQIVGARWLAGCIVGWGTIVPSFVLAAVVAGVPEDIGAVAVAAVFGVAAYIALFALIGCATRRAAVWSMAVVFLGERLLGTALSGVAQISPSWLSRSVFADLATDVPSRFVRDGIPQGSAAVVRLVLLAAVCLALAAWRLGHLHLSGSSD